MTGDLLDLLADLEAPPLVAPQGWTEDMYPLDEFRRSQSAWVKEHGRMGSAYLYPGWQVDRLGVSSQPEIGGHEYAPLTLIRGGSLSPSESSGEVFGRAVCPTCDWASAILPGASHNDLVEAWLEHAWPGWEALPVIHGRRGEHAERDVAAAVASPDYPAEWKVPGAPVRTARSAMGGRHVPSRSPFGGFDLGVIVDVDLTPPADPA